MPLPPFAEQHRIVAEVDRRLSVIQQAEAAVEANLTRADRLRQSILKQAFSGRLVPQDPNDEPASVLLERIRAEREAAQAARQVQAQAEAPPGQTQNGARSSGGGSVTTSSTVGQKLWNYCNVLRDAGLSYGDYLEQLTYLIFLKMMHERTQPPYARSCPGTSRLPFPRATTGPTCSRGTDTSWRPTTAAPWRPWPGSPAPSASYSERPRTGYRSRPC